MAVREHQALGASSFIHVLKYFLKVTHEDKENPVAVRIFASS
jgi:hypothetical protein